jgi:uncharacterized membrane protein YphA (DoxX/SURF4 family)
VASVWLHQGLWAKLLDGDPSHREIVGRLTGVDAARARNLTAAIGALEAGMAVWVLTGRLPRWCAAAQTALVLGFNAGALNLAHDQVPNPRRLLRRNAIFLVTAWFAAW